MHLQLEFVLHGVTAKVADVRIAVILVILSMRLEILLGAEEFLTARIVTCQIRMIHMIDAIVCHDAQLGSDGLVTQMAGIRAVMILDVLLQTRTILEYPLAGSAAGQQCSRILTVILAALHMTSEQVALVESLVTLLAVMQDTIFHTQGLGNDAVLTVLATHRGYVPVNLRDVRRQMIPRRARFRTVWTSHVRMTLVYPVHMFPQVRRPTIILNA